VKRLLTIPGVDRTVALSLVAAVGDIARFAAGQLPRSRSARAPVRQPAGPARADLQAGAGAGARDARRGRLGVREDAGPLRAFFLRVRARRGEQVAAVATARKLAVLCWHLLSRGEDYARPSLVAQKLRALELAAGAPSRRGQRGSTYAYNLKDVRARERALSE